MSATDQIRETIGRVRWLGGRTVEVDVDAAEALCDLADAARALDAESRDLEPGMTYVRVDPAQALRDALARLDGEDGP